MSWLKNLKIIFVSFVFLSLIFLPQKTSALSTVSTRHGRLTFLQIEDPKSFAVQGGKKTEDPETKSRRFFNQYGKLFGIKNQQEELKLISVSQTAQPIKFAQYKLGQFPTVTEEFTPKTVRTHVRFQQVYKNIPVFGQQVIVHLEEGNIQSISSDFTPDIAIESTTPKITAQQAKEKAKQIWQKEGKEPKYIGQPTLYILNPSALAPKENNNYLTWQVEVANSTTSPTEREFLFINAVDGNLVFRLPGIFDAKKIEVRDIGYDPYGQYSNDPDLARDFAGQTYDYYFEKFNRDSFNGRGATIYINARISGPCPNAYWNGSNLNFCAGMATRDVVAHEFTHAVTQYTSGLTYSYQSGAINEGMSDVFGAAVDNDDWTMGEGSVLGIIRYMDDPTKKRQPDRLFSQYYYCGGGDKGGVHINSGIVNKLAYLIAEGGTFNGCTISGLGRETEERILYLAQTKYLTPSSNFLTLYQAIKSACGELFGDTSAECQNVDNAAKAVEIDQQEAGSQQGPRCIGKAGRPPDCSTTSPIPTPSTGPTTSPTTGPTNPSPPSHSPSPTAPSQRQLSIWTTMIQNNQEVVIPPGSKVPIGTLVSLCYNRGEGTVSLTVDRGGGLVSTYSGYFTDGGRDNGCLHAGQRRFFPLGPLASPEGSRHVYTINNNGQTASTYLLVTTGGQPPSGQPLPTNQPPSPSPTIPLTPGQPTNQPTPTSIKTPPPTNSSQQLENIINSVSQEKIRDYLNRLVRKDDNRAEENQTRYSTYDGHQVESDYAKNQLVNFGLGTQFQSFSVHGTATRNVIATLPGKNPNKVYLITAHLDSTAANSGTNDPVPGADDNGSGSAAVLEVARVLSSSNLPFNSSVEFILFSGEEQGLYGSSYYVNHRDNQKTIKGVINLDMIANRGSSGDCVTFGYRNYNGGNVISDKIVAINNQYNIGLKASSIASSITASDHAPFWRAGIPAIFGFECDFSEVYHTINDKTDRINFDQLTKTVKAVSAAVASLALE